MNEDMQDTTNPSDPVVNATRCGLVAIVGRPNVGKSTLLNRILGQHLSITSRRPQTTRYRVMGVHTEGDTQIVFVDTPGWERSRRDGVNRSMNREITAALTGVNLALFVIDARQFGKDDEVVLKALQQEKVPTLLVLNKVDLVPNKENLLPLIDRLSAQHEFESIIPVSAKRWIQGDVLLKTIADGLPEGEFLFAPDSITPQSSQFFAAEILREKLMRQLGDELPYASSVIIDLFETHADGMHISATIWVERKGQKAIVIGAGGETLKQIASAARVDMETLFDTKVFLQTWVKVRENWRNDVQALRQLGFDS
jgi:GTP-binding protein Era